MDKINFSIRSRLALRLSSRVNFNSLPSSLWKKIEVQFLNSQISASLSLLISHNISIALWRRICVVAPKLPKRESSRFSCLFVIRVRVISSHIHTHRRRRFGYRIWEYHRAFRAIYGSNEPNIIISCSLCFISIFGIFSLSFAIIPTERSKKHKEHK